MFRVENNIGFMYIYSHIRNKKRKKLPLRYCQTFCYEVFHSVPKEQKFFAWYCGANSTCSWFSCMRIEGDWKQVSVTSYHSVLVRVFFLRRTLYSCRHRLNAFQNLKCTGNKHFKGSDRQRILVELRT